MQDSRQRPDPDWVISMRANLRCTQSLIEREREKQGGPSYNEQLVDELEEAADEMRRRLEEHALSKAKTGIQGAEKA